MRISVYFVDSYDDLRRALCVTIVYFDVLVQERRNSIGNALELRLSCTNPSSWYYTVLGPVMATGTHPAVVCHQYY